MVKTMTSAMQSIVKEFSASIEREQSCYHGAAKRIRDAYVERFRQGGMVDRWLEPIPHGEKGDALEQLAEQVHIEAPTLREYRRVYQQHGSVEAFRRHMDRMWQEHDRVTWKRAAGLLNGAVDPEEQARQEAQTLLSRAERLDRDVQRYQEEHGETHETAIAAQVAEDAARQVLTTEVRGRIVDEAYLSFVREQPCVCTGVMENVQAHHLVTVGAGGSDYTAVPLYAEVHMGERHAGMSNADLEAKYDVNLWREAQRLNEAYFT